MLTCALPLSLVEYWRNRHQRMNFERFCAANTIALATHAVTQPMDLVKVRSQLLQEGRIFPGIGFNIGFHPFNVFDEIHATGTGIRGMFCSLDAWAVRTVAYTTARIWGFLYFYDWINPDPRRNARIDSMITASLGGGLLAGVLTNPVEMVYTRMQADGMFPEGYRRNYRSFTHGLGKVLDEGVLFRGALANGLRIAALAGSMTNVFDWIKENSYFFFGPSWINRLAATAGAVATGVAVSMPFDAVRTRMHTMRPLPNGLLPYRNSYDCFTKICFFEGNSKYQANPGAALYAGGQAYSARLFLICYLSQFVLDYYHGSSQVTEFWQPARFKFQTGIDYDVHEPFTDGFNKFMSTKWSQTDESEDLHPDGASNFTVV